MPDVIIIGKGPAGISAALYIKRAGLDVTVVGRDGSSLEKADKIENYYGLPAPVSGRQLLETGILQAQRLGVSVITDTVTELGFDDMLYVKTGDALIKAQAVVLASGASRKTVRLPGLSEYEGRGVSYCAVCDGYFHKGKDVAVIGAGAYARSEAHELVPLARSVTVLTNGETPQVDFPEEMRVDTRKIAGITGGEQVSGVRFEDGEELPFSGVFVAMGNASVADLARKLGISVIGSSIETDAQQATNVPGVFAAGDCTGGMYQVAAAVYEGAQAGLSAVKYVRSLK